MILEIDDRLVEQAVLAAVGAGDRALARRFHREREPLYQIVDPEARERAFAGLHRRWFAELGLVRPLREALAEQPLIERSVALCIAVPAARAAEEGAELYVRPDTPGGGEAERLRLVVRLRANTLLDPAAALRLLRAELLYVFDMLDPAFGYEPRLPRASAGPTEDRLLLERYAAAWSATVVGRLVRAGRLPDSARERALARFVEAFPMFRADPEPAFGRFFSGRPPHAELVRFLQAPRIEAAGERARGSRCPLCAMPSYDFVEVDDPGARAALARDFPSLDPGRAVCPQCAELYRVRAQPAAFPM